MPKQPPTAEILARRKLFTAALRSDRFKQGRGQLAIGFAEDRRHCCLGVGCEVAIENGLDLPFRDDEDGDRWYSTTGEPDDIHFNNHSVLPVSVAEWYGFTDIDPDIPVMEFNDMEDRVTEFLFPAAEVNDSKGLDFAQIADAFDAKYVAPYEMPEPEGVLEP